jgi:hypothetical protein
MSILVKPEKKDKKISRTTTKIRYKKRYNNNSNINRRVSINPITKDKPIIKRDHSPTLLTINMVENTIKQSNYFESRNKLSRALPKQIQSNTLKKIITYLEQSNKITIDKNGVIVWIFEDDDKIIKKSLANFKEI